MPSPLEIVVICFLALPICVASFLAGKHSCIDVTRIQRQNKKDLVVRNNMVGNSARDLLYQDQQEAMLRRASHEQEILQRKKLKELKAPKIKVGAPKSGTGFGGSANKASMDPKRRLAEEQAKIVHRDGVLRINGVLSETTADKLREYVLQEQSFAERETAKDPSKSRAYYGVENARKNRCDLQLSLLRGGYAAKEGMDFESHPLADTLQELLGVDGTLRNVYETLVTPQGELYEMATVITEPGSNQQMVHADLPFNPDAPIYVIFLALQDIDEFMGPTSFLLKTHTPKANDAFHGSESEKDNQLKNADCRLATLKKGDCVLFDARTLHAGNSNDIVKGKTRALFNFSFRNPVVTGNLGYDGSIMPGYVGAMSLGDVCDALVSFEEGSKDPFAKYGNGLE